MTVQEAILVLKMIETHGSLPTKSKEVAIECMEKQIPKKPIETEHFNCLNYECPICEGGLYYEQQYCDECGQALDWSDEDV